MQAGDTASQAHSKTGSTMLMPSMQAKNQLLAADWPCLKSVGCQPCPSDNGIRLQAIPLKSPTAWRLAWWRLPTSKVQPQRGAGPARSAKAASLVREPNLQVLLRQLAISDDCCLHLQELHICSSVHEGVQRAANVEVTAFKRACGIHVRMSIIAPSVCCLPAEGSIPAAACMEPAGGLPPGPPDAWPSAEPAALRAKQTDRRPTAQAEQDHAGAAGAAPLSC